MSEKTNVTETVVEETTKTVAKTLNAKQKMIIALCSIVGVVAIIVTSVLATVAYLTSSAAVSNVFTIGNVGITMTETKVDSNGKKLQSGEQVDTNTYHLVPDKTYDKDPHITVNPGSENSYLFVLVRNDLEAIAASTPECPSIAQQMADNGWARYTKASTGWVYVYVGVGNVPDGDITRADNSYVYTGEGIAVNQGTYYLFTEFTIAPNADISTYGAAKITLTAVAIQNTGFANLAEAWAAVTATYPYIHTGNN